MMNLIIGIYLGIGILAGIKSIRKHRNECIYYRIGTCIGIFIWPICVILALIKLRKLENEDKA